MGSPEAEAEMRIYGKIIHLRRIFKKTTGRRVGKTGSETGMGRRLDPTGKLWRWSRSQLIIVPSVTG